ncbi:hypothetical protein BXY39_0090 [Eilatimonas milleporae]|uniref:von Willebrand factor type A domain-containing protein n=2 Tax=Eilatimonas milleporae TaxID=911205 RepID=A0A3M0CUB2_9PROT|nr:hypothetical protein BXY39_0090 [Eilatimonas milleporae]
MSRTRPMSKTRRSVDVFNLSFLDVVSCGFGAVVLLLVIVKVSGPDQIARIAEDLTATVQRLQQENVRIVRETQRVDTALAGTRDALAAARASLASLEDERARLSAKIAIQDREYAAQSAIEAELRTAQQSLSEEMRRLLDAQSRATVDNAVIGGIPVDSEYIIFIIDTSGSMHGAAWPLVLSKVEQVLRIYPEVRGFQVMNDMGNYMFSHYAGRWIPDTPARRETVIKRLRTWAPFSNSSPVEGITRSIRQFAAGDKKISLYIFGDDFAAGSVEAVVRAVDQANYVDTDGNPRVRIHAIGFPTLFALQGDISENSTRFAALMRALAQDNGGSFVGLNSRFEPPRHRGGPPARRGGFR